MYFAEPPRTAYDLRFDLLGFSVRVTPFFWLVAVLLGYDQAVGLHRGLREASPGLFGLLVMWVCAVFLSILIHELGHAIAMRRYGMRAYVVLYHFGGLAITDPYSSVLSMGGYGRRGNQIVISLAGPGAQLLLAAAIVLPIRLTGYQLGFFVWPLDLLLPPADGRPLPSVLLDVMLFFLIMPSILWALINLLPIFPLDGGQVSRELFTMFSGSNGFRDSLVLSIVVAGLAAAYFYSTGSMFNAMLFISLGVSSFQILQSMRFGGGGW